LPKSSAISPDPLALAKKVAGRTWPYAAGLVVVLAVVGAVFRHQLNWGDFPTWVVAITTLLAFLAAAFGGLVAYELFKVETERDLKAAEERSFAAADRQRTENERAAQLDAERRAQASKVTAWFHRFTIDRPMPPRGVVREDTWGAAIRNASDLPILDVQVFFYWVYDPADGGPWSTDQRHASLERIRVIPPGQTQDHELPYSVRRREHVCNTQVYLVGIEFTDANGRRWFRNERAALLPR
jgi:hypothetical protein